MELQTFIFSYSNSFYIITDDNEEEAWKTLTRKLSISEERAKENAKLIAHHYRYGFTKLKKK